MAMQFTDLMEAVRGRLGEARLGVQKAGELEDPAGFAFGQPQL
ncbi:MAG TPA: hypothetical protein VGX23_00035 [Actinocrinis sp.]|nr:hypothetical protein [Actinocrinis sp.]